MVLDNNSKMLINLLLDAGYKAYAVGGCVRDELMGVPPKDVDITTSATPDEVEQILTKNGIRYVETGLQHGTVSAIVEHKPYEITTFRCDGLYLDNRHPSSVVFIKDIKEDLARRDFTMNAIAYNERDGYYDAFGGIDDIKAKTIRAVGDANKRFCEDALRIMRALRFSSVLGFEIEQNTKDAIFANKELLKNIAVERIFVELTKLLKGKNCENVLMEYRDIIAVVIPELKASFDCDQNSKWHLYDVYTHTVKSVAFCEKRDCIPLVLLLHDVAKPYVKTTDKMGNDHFKGHQAKGAEIAEEILKRLKVSKEVLTCVTKIIGIHDLHINDSKKSIKKFLNLLGEELIFDFVDVRIADCSSHNLELVGEEMKMLQQIKPKIQAVIDSNEAYKLSQLAINGFDLKVLGYDGNDIAVELQRLLKIVIDEPSQNTKKNLLNIAKNDRK